jgi:hypothetical protein
MTKSRILQEVPIPEPVNGVLCVNFELQCYLCEGSGWVPVPEGQMEEMRRHPPSSYQCLKHTPKPS